MAPSADDAGQRVDVGLTREDLAPIDLAEGVRVGVGISGGTTEEDIDVLDAALQANI